MVRLTIPRVTVLRNAASPDTAYTMLNEPHPGHRTRFWIETAARGRKAGHVRPVSQVVRPSEQGSPVYGPPRRAPYTMLAWLYIEPGNVQPGDGVQALSLGFEREGYAIDPATDTRVQRMGIYDAMTTAERATYARMLAVSKKCHPEMWQRWEQTVALIAADLNADPIGQFKIRGRTHWRDSTGHDHVINEPAAYLAAARDRLPHPTVLVHTENSYACGRHSESIHVVHAPDDDEDEDGIERWVEDTLGDTTGDGHPCGSREHAVYEATVIDAANPALLGLKFSGEG